MTIENDVEVMRWPENETELFASSSIVDTVAIRKKLNWAITNHVQPTYIYTYPPRQCYRPLPTIVDDSTFVMDSLRETPKNFNLYIHFPFCKQICHYCNLYAVAGQDDTIDEYVHAISRELKHYRDELGEIEVKTVYLGGGTPSVLNEKQLASVFESIEAWFPNFRDKCEEICIESAPDTLNKEKAHLFKSLGINRVNLGVQTFQNNELLQIGRKHGKDVCLEAIEALKLAEIDNLCVDLINGLLGQTRESWEESVRRLVDIRPETICIYPLVVRPATGYHKHSDMLKDHAEIYARYDIAWDLLSDNEYEQETNVRFVIPGKGAYKQIQYHWEGATILGVGAGARTYAPRIHFRNGYSSRNRIKVLKEYFERIEQKGHARKDGVLLDFQEQVRREFILNLHRIDKGRFRSAYGIDFDGCFPNHIEAFAEEGLVLQDGENVSFTPKGFKYRDLISRLFFSNTIMNLEEMYSYDD